VMIQFVIYLTRIADCNVLIGVTYFTYIVSINRTYNAVFIEEL